MSEEPSARIAVFGLDLRRLLGIAALVAYVIAVLGVLNRTILATLVSAGALAALAAALFAYTAAATPRVAQQRLGGRAQATRRRVMTLVVAALGTLYIALVLGVQVTSVGALWDCLGFPACAVDQPGAQLALAHRGVAGLATLLVVALAIHTWRSRTEQVLRRAVGWAFGLILVQNLVGMIQVMLARGGASLPVGAARLLHLGIGAAAWGALIVLATLLLRLPAPQTSPAPAGAWPTMLARLKDYISLTKPGVISLLIFTTLAGMLITPVGLPSLDLVFWTLLGGWLMPAGAHALNCYIDRDIDVLMGRTGRRPLPSGRMPAWHALALGLALVALAFAILALFVNLTAALLALAGCFYYVVVYSLWLKRSSVSNIVIGGGAGAFPPLIGWAAVTGGLTLPALLLFAIIFYWTPPHFWALALIREQDYARAGVPMLPVVAGDAETKRQILLYTLLMVILTLLLTPLQVMGLPYLVLALVLAVLFIRYVLRLLRDGTSAAAWRLYRFSLLYLALLFAAMVIDRVALS